MKYEIKGEPLPVAICNLQPGESIICESGAMCWMSPNMQMETVGGGAGKMLGRMFSGESMFQNRYTAKGGPGLIAVGSSFPGSIRAIQVDPAHPIVIQKRAFLAAEPGVELSVFFQKKMGAGFFGGEGFIMQQLSGNGLVFLEIDGSAVEYDLGPGEQIIADTGYVAMMDASCRMDIQTVKGMKNVLFGGEGLFNTVVTGPGHVVLQTMPLTGFAGAIASVLPRAK
ncbi:MAG: TIGR00266 family protein [Oscillospiraceae bacterium]|nr:TIGR00266 family protein [Oscillospiraceae bacterium]